MLVTMLKEVSDASFEADVLKADGPVLVCYLETGTERPDYLEQFAEDYAGRLTIVTLNIDQNPVVPARYGVRGAPVLMLFKDHRSFS